MRIPPCCFFRCSANLRRSLGSDCFSRWARSNQAQYPLSCFFTCSWVWPLNLPDRSIAYAAADLGQGCGARARVLCVCVRMFRSPEARHPKAHTPARRSRSEEIGGQSLPTRLAEAVASAQLNLRELFLSQRSLKRGQRAKLLQELSGYQFGHRRHTHELPHEDEARACVAFPLRERLGRCHAR